MTKRRFMLLALLVAALAFLAAGCGGDDDDSRSGPTAPTQGHGRTGANLGIGSTSEDWRWHGGSG